MHHWWLKIEESEPFVTAQNFLNEQEIVEIIKIGKDANLSDIEEGKIGGRSKNNELDLEYRRSSISWIRSDVKENSWIFAKITDAINDINSQFFNYDLDLIQGLQFSEYGEKDNGFYGKHVDTSYRSYRTRKLSFSVQLSDSNSYEGGDLKLYLSNSTEASRTKGDLIVFPSYTLHEVTPVTKGTRYSLVGWAQGPKFR